MKLEYPEKTTDHPQVTDVIGSCRPNYHSNDHDHDDPSLERGITATLLGRKG